MIRKRNRHVENTASDQKIESRHRKSRRVVVEESHWASTSEIGIDCDKASTSEPFSRYIANISKFSCDILLILKIALFHIINTLNPSALNLSHINGSLSRKPYSL